MRIKLSKNSPAIELRSSPKEKKIIEGWRDDPRMVFLANPGRDLTAKERKEWERNIGQYQITYRP